MSSTARFPRAHTIWRRLLVLLIGGLVAIPYGLIGVWAVGLFVTPMPSGTAAVARASAVVVLLILAVPAVLPVTRTLERTVANQLLDVRLPEPAHAPSAGDVARGAAFYAGHLVSGGLLMLAIGFVLPLLGVFVADAVGGGSEGVDMLAGVLLGISTVGAAAACAVVMLALVAFLVGAGYLLPAYAVQLLGPSAAEREAAAVDERARLARRGELARELHDTVGHALTVTTMQAALAARSVPADATRARGALAEIEKAGRRAVADLDYVLGVLRANAEAPLAKRPLESLTDLDALVADLRAAGLDVTVSVDGDVASVPESLGREAFRIAQEALTNALRHASRPRASLDVRVGEDALLLRIVNPSERADGVPGGGLRGIRERVELLGGSCRIGMDSGEWAVECRLPLRPHQGKDRR